MIELVVALTVLIPVLLALIWPNGLAAVVLLTGVLPLTLGHGEMMVTVFGRMDLSAIRLLGLWVATLLVIVPRLWQAGKYGMRFRWHLLFLMFAMLALVWAPNITYGARMIVKLTAPFLFLLLILVSCDSWQSLKRLEMTMLVSGIVAVAVSLASVLGGYTSFSSQLGLGVPGLGPAASSANLAILAMLALALVRTSPSWSMAALLGILAAASFAGFTRITIVGLLIGTTAVLWLSFRGVSRWAFPLVGVVSVPALFLLSDTFRQRMFKGGEVISLDRLLNNPLTALDSIHGSGRFDAWSYVLTTFFKPNPVFGSGIGTTQHYFYTHFTGLNVIHSEYIRLLAEVGILGVSLLVIAAAVYLVRLTHTFRAAMTREGRAYALAGLGALVVYLIFMATDNAIDYVTSCGIFVFALIAMSEKARELEEKDSCERAQETKAIAPGVFPAKGVGFDPMPSRRFPLVSWR
jgi:O-antigen ligase